MLHEALGAIANNIMLTKSSGIMPQRTSRLALGCPVEMHQNYQRLQMRSSSWHQAGFFFGECAATFDHALEI
jgi:hypothetical protein